jgi:hypothetical protein
MSGYKIEIEIFEGKGGQLCKENGEIVYPPDLEKEGVSVDPNFDDHETSEVFKCGGSTPLNRGRPKCGAKSTFWAPIWGKSRAKSPVVAPDQPLGGAVGPLHG